MSLEIKERIVVGSDELFMRFGIKSVTMDDIAAHLSVSKKTIYQHFKDKDALVIEVSKVHMDMDIQEVERIVEESENAVHEMFLMSQYIRSHVKKMNPSILFDLKKYHPKAWDMFSKHKVDCIYKAVVRNIERGQEEGSYRPEVDARIVSVMRMQSVEMAFDPALYPFTEFDILEVNMQLLDHFIHGLITPLGLEQLTECVKAEQ